MDLPDGHRPAQAERRAALDRGDLIAGNRLKFELFRRFGALPAAGDRHLAEFFPGFLTEESEWGGRWGVHLTTIEDRERHQGQHQDELERDVRRTRGVGPAVGRARRRGDRLARHRPPARRCRSTSRTRASVPTCPTTSWSRACAPSTATACAGATARVAPPVLAEQLRRVVVAQELTVDAAIAGRRDDVLAAMLADPLAGRMDFDALGRMTDELLDATRAWLPQFA